MSATLPEQIALLTSQLAEANAKVGTLTTENAAHVAALATVNAELTDAKSKMTALESRAEAAIQAESTAKAALVTAQAAVKSSEAKAVELMARVGQPAATKVDSPAATQTVNPVNDPKLSGLDRTIAVFAQKNAEAK